MPSDTQTDIETPKETSALTPSALAVRLGCSVKTIRRAIAAGELVAVKLAREYRIEPADAEIFIADRKQAARRKPAGEVAA